MCFDLQNAQLAESRLVCFRDVDVSDLLHMQRMQRQQHLSAAIYFNLYLTFYFSKINCFFVFFLRLRVDYVYLVLSLV